MNGSTEKLKQMIKRADEGKSVYITQITDLFEDANVGETETIFVLLMLAKETRPMNIPIKIPSLENVDESSLFLIKEYVAARIYNIISIYGGREITLYTDSPSKKLENFLDLIISEFSPEKSRKDRVGYGRALNVAERMSEVLNENSSGSTRFEFRKKEIDSQFKESLDSFLPETPNSHEYSLPSLLRNISSQLKRRAILGMDIGGSDIKMILSIDGKIEAFKEYDWFPSEFKTIQNLINPILLLVQWARAMATVCSTGNNSLREIMNSTTSANVSDKTIRDAVEKVETNLNGELQALDEVGLCFPDAVAMNKIVGGEVYKTRGIRNNPDINYEEEFRRLTNLDEKISAFCRNSDSVKIINDGPMAAFTAAVEMAFCRDESTRKKITQGVFAHTLGTELGTGWINTNGDFPDIPLEVYNCIIDLGCRPERQYQSDDPRSLNNFNTELPGTLQKYVSQSGVFRLAMKYLPKENPNLYKRLFEEGFLEHTQEGNIRICQSPKDMRKSLLEHLMRLASHENIETCRKIFREIGEYLSVTWEEVCRILNPETDTMILFGRLVKDVHCFELIREGALAVNPKIILEVANDESAETSLMKQLRDSNRYTVPQFAQAVGAVYFAVFKKDVDR